jgi:PPP family 3-phenylpropionic acid transporter
MRRLKIQFFFSYGIFGCIGPLLPVYLKEIKGFDERQLGVNQALTSIATILAPCLITLLADLRIDPRRILTIAFIVSLTAFSFILNTTGVGWTLAFYTLHSLAFIPTVALQDGYYFTLTKARGLPQNYHQIRVWGTIGFIAPSLVLFFCLRNNPNHLHLIFIAAIAFAVISALHSFRLPAPPAPTEAKTTTGSRLPSTEAFVALFSPRGRFFCLALMLAMAATTAYHTFFPLYLREIVQVKSSIVGLIINVGVLLEIVYILAIGRLQKRFGIQRLMVFGFAAMTTRLLLLALFPNVFTAVATQVLHGAEICAVFVLPIGYLNTLASDRFRNSIQGVYTMVVIGVSRVVGSLAAGQLAEIDIIVLFFCAAGVAFAAMMVTATLFRPEPD